MPQKDRYRDRTVELDFDTDEHFENLPYPDRFSLVLVTAGSAPGTLNGRAVVIAAPCVLCLSEADSITVESAGRLAAQTLSFASDFFGLPGKNGTEPIPTGLSVFRRGECSTGLFPLEKADFVKLREWLFILGTEVCAQSDALWVCRIKKYLLQILGMLADLCLEQDHDPVNAVRSYISRNYFKKITLEELCRRAHTNRVSLNRLFRARHGCTAMEYLNLHRLRTAEKILTYTRMNLNDVAHAAGFEYDTYFIRQFTRWKGVSPTKFRRVSQRLALGDTDAIL